MFILPALATGMAAGALVAGGAGANAAGSAVSIVLSGPAVANGIARGATVLPIRIAGWQADGGGVHA